MQVDFDNTMRSIEENFGQRLDKLFQLVETMGKGGNNQNRESLPRSDYDILDNVPSLERRPNNSTSRENIPLGERRPQIISLDPNLDQELGSPRISRNLDFDTRSEISLHINNNERDKFSNICSVEDSVTGDSSDRENTNTETTKRKSVNVQNSDSIADNSKQIDKSEEGQTRSNLLSQIFKEDIVKEKSSVSLILDQAQVNILDNSWWCKNPERLSAYEEDYRIAGYFRGSKISRFWGAKVWYTC